MESDRLLAAVVLFGLGAGAAAEIVAQEAVSGLTGLWAILIAGGGLAVLGIAVWTIIQWPMEFQVTIAFIAIFIGYL